MRIYKVFKVNLFYKVFKFKLLLFYESGMFIILKQIINRKKRGLPGIPSFLPDLRGEEKS